MLSALRDLQGGEELSFTLHLCIFYITDIFYKRSLDKGVAVNVMWKMSLKIDCLITKFKHIEINNGRI